jgi:hypothetical protein
LREFTDDADLAASYRRGMPADANDHPVEDGERFRDLVAYLGNVDIDGDEETDGRLT